mgnify:CR=1 FL=1
MYKLELFKDGKKIRELIFLDNEIELMDIYRLKNHWEGGTSKVWKLIIDNDVIVEKGGPINDNQGDI